MRNLNASINRCARRKAGAFLLVVPILSVLPLPAEGISEPGGVSIAVATSGEFTIQAGNPAWTYAGKIAGQVKDIRGPARGFDHNQVSTSGPFDEFTVDYSDFTGYPWRMQLRAYRDIPSASFSFSPLVTVPNRQPYAVLTRFPITPHHFSNGGWNRTFGPLSWMYADSPWIFFDDQYRSSILSAASRPISQRQRWFMSASADGTIALEIDSSNALLPAHDVYSHVITFDQGIGKTFDTWGSTLRGILGRPGTGSQADLSLRMPMLSTDAGATYYYAFNPALGYAGTLRAAITSAKTAGIPLGVVHFDSWWQLKGGDCNGLSDASDASWKNGSRGAWKYVMDPALFPPIDPADLEEGFVQNLGPGMAHGRWVDTCSPYRLPIRDSAGHVLVAHPVSGNVITDLSLWRRVAHTLQQSGIVTFEPDFLSASAQAVNTFDDEKFFNALALAMGEQGLALQYCMPLARHMLEAFRHPEVHTIRASGDRFGWRHWEEELYSSIVLNAGGVWPTVDNFRTTEKRNLLLAVLSGGPLPLGDRIGGFVPIPEAIRSDGLILKPDVSLVPSDASFVAEASAIEQFYDVEGHKSESRPVANDPRPVLPPLVAHTHSSFESGQVEYVFAYSRDLNAAAPVSFAPQDFALAGEVYVYDCFRQAGWRQSATESIHALVDSQGSYFVLAPVGPSGIAFLGDLSKFVPASKQRVTSLSDDGQVRAALQFDPPETASIWFFAPSTPAVFAEGAMAGAPQFDAAAGLYWVTVTSRQNTQATLRLALQPAL